MKARAQDGIAGRIVRAIRELVAPSYRPELHYMRGPGPAVARRCGAGH